MSSVQLASILISDLVGSTGLETRVGPAIADDLRREHFAVLREAIAEKQGEEVKNTGDGLMAAFTSASGAIECAELMQQLMERRNRKSEEHLHVRIGISSGEATVEDGDYFGMPSIEAARLCDKAPSDGILVSASTRILAGRRDQESFESVGELDLKGIPDPVEAFAFSWSPIGAELSAVPLPAALRSVPAMAYVGRKSERESATSWLSESLAGQRRAAFISGEPGVGKTRLAAHSALEAHSSGFTVLWGVAAEDLGVPYGAWIHALSQYVNHAPDEVLEAHVARHGGELGRLVRGFRQRVPEASEPQQTDPETERYLLFSAVADILEAAAAHDPVVLVLDDLHWADTQTLALIKHVTTSLESSRLMLVGTYRDSDLDQQHPMTALLADLRLIDGTKRIALRGLGVDEITQMMAATAGHEMDEKGVALAREIAQETDGNPFFVAEILRHLIESGALTQGEDGRWRMSASIPELGIPQSVREVVGRRVTRLGEATARILSTAAVIGRTFDVNLLSRIVVIGEDELLDALDEGVESSVLNESSDTVGRFSFAHALINHTLYDELGATRKARLHRQVAEALEELCGEDPGERIPELAYHWSRATTAVDPGKAVHYAQRAGDRALAKLAPNEALRWFGQAFELLGDDAEGNLEIRCELLTGLGQAQRQVGDLGFRETLLEAVEVAHAAGSAELASRAALANNRGHVSSFGVVDEERVAAIDKALELDDGTDKGRRARLLALKAAELQFNGDHLGRRQLADEALVLTREVEDDRVLAAVLRDHFIAHWAGDTVEVRTKTTDELIQLARTLDDSRLETQAEGAAFNVSLERGEMKKAGEHVAREVELAEGIGQPGLKWQAYYHASCFALLEGRLADARRFADDALAAGSDSEPDAVMLWGGMVAAEAMEGGREDEVVELLVESAKQNPGLPAFAGAAILSLGRMGREDEARAMLDKYRERGFDALARDVAWSSALGLFARAVAELEDRESAAQLTPLLEPLQGLNLTNGSSGFGTADQCLALLAVTEGDLERADRWFQAAVAFESQGGMHSSLALTKLWWARSLLREGSPSKSEHAKSLLKDSIELSTEHGYAYYRREAERMLEESTPVGAHG
ncbi:MAG TPA: AAA family ATPase [Solirubrobacterales bacterium]|nr:AAA family ATPase [Solirubrobacterales bacterium]